MATLNPKIFRSLRLRTQLSAVNCFLKFLDREGCKIKFLCVQVFREQSRELTRAEYQRLLDAARGETDINRKGTHDFATGQAPPQAAQVCQNKKLPLEKFFDR